MADCPSDDLLAAFVSAELETEVAAGVERHLGDCSRCAAAVAIGSPAATEPALEKGGKLDRYHILGLAGSGAVGLVYAAYDPKLDRKVALKVLRRADPELEERLLREARAMARVTSPHVVAVHDSGTAGGRVHVAMEYVEGPTLRAWLGERRRSVAEIVAIFIQAGRGLAAAHAAGIVHRDFKPENVLIRPDGQATVTDFGLALAAADPAAATDGRSGERSDDLHLTSTGAMVGTPADMAPEQMRGERADARSDLFSFCVALHAALHGRHPFPIGSLGELTDAVKRGAVRGEREPAVPARVRDAVLAGLRPRPEDRPASMDELLARLARRPARRAGIAVAALAFLGAAGVVAVRSPPAAAPPCRGAERRLAGVWDAARRAELGRALAGSPLAADAARGIGRALDDYAGRWVAARTEVCEATRVRGEQSEAVLDRRMACLDERLLRLGALARSIERAGATQAAGAIVAAYNLPGIERCAAATDLGPAAAPADGPRLVLARAALARAAAQGQLGDRDGGRKLLAPALAVAAATGDRALAAEAHVVEGLLWADSDPRAAESSFEAAAVAAQAAGRPDLAARAWIQLARRIGTERTDEALRWTEYALAASERAGDELLRAETLTSQAIVQTWAHRSDVGLGLFREALAIVERQRGPDARELVDPLKGVAWTLRLSGKTDEALALITRASAINARTFGPAHPATLALRSQVGCALEEIGRNQEARAALVEVVAAEERLGEDLALAGVLDCLALVQFNTGNYGEAAATYGRSLAIMEKANGATSPKLVYDLGMRARALALAGDHAAADAATQRGVAIAAALEPDHVLRAVALLHRGDVLFRAGRCREALPVAEEARARFMKRPTGAGDIDASWAMDTLGRCQRALGRLAAAEATFLAALAIREKAYGAKHYAVADALIALASIHHDLGADARALAEADRAVAMLEGSGQAGDLLGEARLRSAEAQWSTDRPRAIAAARAAIADLSRFPAEHPVRREAEEWLARHGGE